MLQLLLLDEPWPSVLAREISFGTAVENRQLKGEDYAATSRWMAAGFDIFDQSRQLLQAEFASEGWSALAWAGPRSSPAGMRTWLVLTCPVLTLRPTDLAGTDRVSTNSVRVGSIDAGSEALFPAEADVFPGWLPWLETCTSDRLSVKPDVAVNKGALGLDSEDSRGPSERHQFPQIFDASHRHQPEVNTLSGLIHDTRNMVTTIGLYCDLLEEPGVLSAPFGHYAGELRIGRGQ